MNTRFIKLCTFSLLLFSLLTNCTKEVVREPLHFIRVVYRREISTLGKTWEDAYRFNCDEQTAEDIMNGKVTSYIDKTGLKFNLTNYQTLQWLIE